MALAPVPHGPPESVRLLQSHSLTLLVQREIERMILAGEIAVGEKLNEVALAAGLGVSRGPVRESFRALEETGLVRIEKNRGVFVREISRAEAADIYEIRATFDQMAGRKLAQGISAEQLDSLRALLAEMQAATEASDLPRYHALNLRFHDTLVGYANNPKLLQMYRRLVNELGLYRRLALAQRDRLPASTREHQRIVASIAAGDADRAGRLLYEHAMASRERLQTLPASAAPAPSRPAADRTVRSGVSTQKKRAAAPAIRGHVAEGVIKA
jgi:phosphonate utilization transcriptional regulator